MATASFELKFTFPPPVRMLVDPIVCAASVLPTAESRTSTPHTPSSPLWEQWSHSEVCQGDVVRARACVCGGR